MKKMIRFAQRTFLTGNSITVSTLHLLQKHHERIDKESRILSVLSRYPNIIQYSV